MKTCDTQTGRDLAFILGVAVAESFNSAQIIQIWSHGTCFFADIVLGTKWEDSFLPLVEKKMSELLQEDISFDELETTPASAAGLFALKKQKGQIDKLPKAKNVLVQILRRGDWAMLAPENRGENAGCFSLVEGYEVGEWNEEVMVRFYGVFEDNPMKLKKNLKDTFRLSEIHPTTLVEKLKVLHPSDGEWIWLPEGESCRLELLNIWRAELAKENFSFISMPQCRNWLESCKETIALGIPKSAQLSYLAAEEQPLDFGPLTPQAGYCDLFTLCCPEERLQETLISCLQLIRRTPKIFSFNAQMVLCASRNVTEVQFLRKALARESCDFTVEFSERAGIECRIVDAMGQQWSGPKIEVAKEKPKPGWRAVVGTFYGPWERFFSLAVQKERGSLPKFEHITV